MIDKTKTQHVQVPNPSGFKDLKILDYLVYANLRTFANKDTLQCYPSIRTLANKCKLTPNTIQESLKRLLKYGHITIMPEKHNGKNNIYQLKKLNDHFEMFTNEFLDDPNLTPNEKAYIICLQSKCYKNGKFALTTLNNTELSNTLNISTKSIKRYDTSLKAKDIITELQTFDENKFNKTIKAIDLVKIKQDILFQVASNHEGRIQHLEKVEDRVQQLEKMVAILISENKRLKKLKESDIVDTEFEFC